MQDRRLVNGHLILYQHPGHARPNTFLQRNLRRVLDSHERRILEGIEDVPITTEHNEDKPTQHTFDDLLEHIVGSDAKIMSEAMKASTPTLRISGIRLQKTSKVPHSNREPRTPPTAQDDGPSWLPPPDDSKLSCNVTVAIIDRMADRRDLYMEETGGTIIRAERDRAASGFDVCLEKEFVIPLHQIVSRSAAFSDPESFSLNQDGRFQIEVTVQCRTPNDTAKFLSQIEDSAENYSKLPTSEGIVRTEWGHFPSLPKPGQLLPLTRRKNHKREQMQYKAELVMKWNKKASALDVANRAFRRRRAEPRQLPTPVSDDLEERKSTCAVRYLTQHGAQTHRIDSVGFRCILCPQSSEHPSFERLWLHLNTHHSHFRFETYRSEESDEGSRSIRIFAPEETSHSKDDSDWEWEAPPKPFDAKAYLNGDLSWSPRTMSRMKSAREKAKEASTHEQRESSHEKRRTLPPEHVQDLPEPKRRKHKVPNVPGISFYRTTSKRKIQPGEELSDSDEEPDEFWFAQNQRYNLAKLPMDNISRDFNELFNKHLDLERPTSDRLTRDAVVRFARKFAAKLREPRWKDKFRAKLDQMENRRIFANDTVIYCMELLEKAPNDHAKTASADGNGPHDTARASNGRDSAHPSNRVRWKDGRMSSEDTESSKDAHSSSNRGPFGERDIICSRPATATLAMPMSLRRMLRHESKGKPVNELSPSDVAYEKLRGALIGDPFYMSSQSADSLACVVHETPLLIVDQHDLECALKAAATGSTGPIRIEILSPEEVARAGDEAIRRAVEASESLQSEPETTARRPPTGKGKDKEPEQPKRPKKRLCVCEKRVDGMRGAIACQNPRCTRIYHMDCVGLDKRLPEWRCPECL